MKKTYFIEHPVMKLSLIIFHSLMFRFHLNPPPPLFFLNVFLVMHADHNDHHDDSYYPGACSSQCLLWRLCIVSQALAVKCKKSWPKLPLFMVIPVNASSNAHCLELCINTLLLFMF